MTVLIRYCGGCNPRYDRTEIVRRLKERFPGLLFSYDKEERCEAAVIVCGCSSACADHVGYNGIYGKMIIWQDQNLEALYQFIADIYDCEESRE